MLNVQIGFRYGSLAEDYYTGYHLHSQGWISIFCQPKRPAFLGDIPITLLDVINQQIRWGVGLLEVAFSRYSPLTFGMKALGPLMSLCYANYAFNSIWSIPITAYSFLPQLILLNKIYIFPKVCTIKLVGIPWRLDLYYSEASLCSIILFIRLFTLHKNTCVHGAPVMS